MSNLECDYLVIGTGAVGMAFVDTLLDESDATVIMVDEHHQPGGHWNDAYPFVRLHQPSHFYGVASTPLGSKRVDESGSNTGYFELASGTEVQSYFEQVMRHRFLPSGRVQYFPMSRVEGQTTFRNLLSGETREVTVRKKVVDSTYFKTSVPSRHERSFEVADEVTCIAPNALPDFAAQYEHFCILGAGKTAMDAGVWLLDHGVAGDRIHWVCPRSAWMMNRRVTQGSVEFFEQSVGGFANQLEAIRHAESVTDLFDRLEACGFMLRIDREHRPEMFHFAVISEGEVEQLRRIVQVIRKGRVAAIEARGLQMASGESVPMPSGTLYVDCTASAVDFTHRSTRPIYEPGRITIQGVRIPNPCLSAALAAYVEAHYPDDAERNRVMPVVHLPDNELGFLESTLGNMMNQALWSGSEPGIRDFVTNCRLDGFGAVIRDADHSNPVVQAILAKTQEHAIPAAMNLHKLIEEARGA